jgi:hypothetical protein
MLTPSYSGRSARPWRRGVTATVKCNGVNVLSSWPVSRDASSHNNVVGASARLRRAPEYTARRLWWSVDGGDSVGRSVVDERSCLAPRRQPLNVSRNGNRKEYGRDETLAEQIGGGFHARHHSPEA